MLADHPLLLTGATVVAWREVQGLDQGDDVEPELVRGRMAKGWKELATDEIFRKQTEAFFKLAKRQRCKTPADW
jgi:hypothetical protein